MTQIDHIAHMNLVTSAMSKIWALESDLAEVEERLAEVEELKERKQRLIERIDVNRRSAHFRIKVLKASIGDAVTVTEFLDGIEERIRPHGQ